jgi:hypothetical protein
MIGLWDTKDNLWVGSDSGPLKFEDDESDLARVAAQMVDTQTGQHPGRTIAKPFPDGFRPRKVDNVPILMSPEEALKKLEEGSAI